MDFLTVNVLVERALTADYGKYIITCINYDSAEGALRANYGIKYCLY